MKSIRILIFGNIYGNDAVAYLKKMLITKYEEVIIGRIGESLMTINDHYHNIDDDPLNDYIFRGNPFSVHYKTVNDEMFDLPADYKTIVGYEPWDYVIFYQGPNNADTLNKEETEKEGNFMGKDLNLFPLPMDTKYNYGKNA